MAVFLYRNMVYLFFSWTMTAKSRTRSPAVAGVADHTALQS